MFADTLKITIAITLILLATVGKVFLFSEWLEKHPNIKKIGESRTTYIVLLVIAILLLAGVFQDINAVREALNVPPPTPKAPLVPQIVIEPSSAKASVPSLPIAGIRGRGNDNKIGGSTVNVVGSGRVVTAPNGIAIDGGTVTNPTVNNNFVPPSRSIEGLDRTNLVSALSLTKAKAIVAYQVSDNEAAHFAQNIYSVLKDAGWELEGDLPAPITGNLPPGLRVGFHGEAHPENGTITIDDRTLEGSVIKALAAAHIQGLYVNSRPNLSGGTIEFLVSSNPADSSLR